MADVFISYAREDRAHAERLADALTGRGVAVWWDRALKGGAAFHDEIERELEAATRVIVLWSDDARRSHWVRDEAGFAQEAEKLSPLCLNGCLPPLGFRSFHSPPYEEALADLDAFLTDLGLTAVREQPQKTQPETKTPPKSTTPEGKTKPANRGADLRYDLSITVEEAVTGKTASIEVPVRTLCRICEGAANSDHPCSTCSGAGKVRATQGFFTIERTCPNCEGDGKARHCDNCSGVGFTESERTLQVNVPAGVETGTRIRLSGEGEASPDGGKPGDLYIFLDIADGHFRAEGRNLVTTYKVRAMWRQKSADIQLPSGGTVRVKIPADAKTGKRLRIPGRGLPAIPGKEDKMPAGDLFIELEVG